MAIELNREHWPRNEPKRLAVVLGGGGSLGAYEAGAIIELLYALETFNRQLPAEGDREPFRLDVITGASAGGMTACVLARIMLYDIGRRADLYRAWVQDIRMDGLLQDSRDVDESNALLGKGLIRSIAASYLQKPPLDPVARASFAPNPGADPAKSELRDRELLLALTLTNMDGFDYVLDTRTVGQGRDRRYLTTRFSDVALFPINETTFHDLDWSVVAKCAIACGNFPIAFQPQTLGRNTDDYPDHSLQIDSLHWPAALTFVDGGIFDNEPLGKAISLAARHDPNGMPHPGRLFLTVHPNLTHSAHSDSIKENSGIVDQAKRLFSMLLTENAVSDWVRANKVNVLAGWKDEFVKSLSLIVLSTELKKGESKELSERLRKLAEDIASAKVENPADAQRYLRDGVSQIRERYAQGLAANKLEVFGLVLFILDHVSELQRKEKLWFEVIGHHPRVKLAGSQVSGFAGFFKEDWREYDYRRGRLDTWRALTGWATPEEDDRNWDESWWQGTVLRGQRDPARAILGAYEPEPLDQQPTTSLVGRRTLQDSEYYTEGTYWKERTGLKQFPLVEFKDFPPELQDALKDRIVDRVLQAFNLGGLRGLIAKKFVASKLDHALGGAGEEGEGQPSTTAGVERTGPPSCAR